MKITEAQIKRLIQKIAEEIDTEDEEGELMTQWYGGDEDDEDNPFDDSYDRDAPYRDNYSYENAYDSPMDNDDNDPEDFYDLKNKERVDKRMRRSVEVGAGGASDAEPRRKYSINGEEVYLTPIEYRTYLRKMGMDTPERETMKYMSGTHPEQDFDDHFGVYHKSTVMSHNKRMEHYREAWEIELSMLGHEVKKMEAKIYDIKPHGTNLEDLTSMQRAVYSDLTRNYEKAKERYERMANRYEKEYGSGNGDEFLNETIDKVLNKLKRG
jgi:hypothetical protein